MSLSKASIIVNGGAQCLPDIVDKSTNTKTTGTTTTRSMILRYLNVSQMRLKRKGVDCLFLQGRVILKTLTKRRINLSKGHDANSWVKTPGEGDGRLFASGTYHECLLEHTIECDDTCPAYVPKINGEFAREKMCTCDPDELLEYSYDDDVDY